MTTHVRNETRDIAEATQAVPADIKATIRHFIEESFLFGGSQDLNDTTSLLDAGILDSTGAMELVAFLDEHFAIEIGDRELVPDNLDSIERISAFVARKLA